jgi:hypothetical protein
VRQVPWRVQLLVSALEEAAKYAAVIAAPCNATDVHLPSGLYARNGVAVVAAAVAVCWLVEALYLAAYAWCFEARASTGKGTQRYSDARCSKAEAIPKQIS